MDGPIRNPIEERAVFDHQELDWAGIAKDIVEEFSCLISDVEQMLSHERHQIEQEAQIKAFIPVLAIK